MKHALIIRVPETLIASLEQLMVQLQHAQPGRSVSRSDAARDALYAGLQALGSKVHAA